MSDNAVYKLKNLDCADCARKFEDAVKKIPGVVEARVSFTSAKLQVVGDVDFSEIKKVGELKSIQVIPENEEGFDEQEGINKNSLRAATLSGIALIIGWIFSLSGNSGSEIIYLLAIIIGGYQTFKKGFRNIFRAQFDMSVLMSVAVIGAMLIGEWLEGGTVAFLFSVSEVLESYTADKARQSLKGLMDMTPTVATVIRGEAEIQVSAEYIKIGDLVLVKPGEKIPVDGIVAEGSTEVNQAAITGESVLSVKVRGNEVYAGTINQTGAVKIRVTKKMEDTTLAKIIHLVEEAQSKKAQTQTFIDKFAMYYTPAVMVLAALIMLVPPIAFGWAWHDWIYRGLALLVVACPCALVITTPVVVVSAIGNAAKNGVLIKGGIHLERLHQVNVVAFDKTGTLTKGRPVVNKVIAVNGEEPEVLALAASVEKYSEHPLADAIVKEALERGVLLQKSGDFQALPGKGAEALVNDQIIRVGNNTLFFEVLDDQIRSEIDKWEKKGNTVTLVGTQNKILGILVLSDEMRNDAYQVMQDLKELKIKETVMLTGDSEGAARAIARKVGIDTLFAKLLPADKVSKIEKLKKENTVMMVGDGINDAPALAASDVSVAMGMAGTDTALETADVVLMADDLSKLPFALKLSQNSMKIIKQNIAIALGLKLLAVIAVFPGWLTLWIAIMADMGANVIVTLNGLRLVRYKEKTEEIIKIETCACSGT